MGFRVWSLGVWRLRFWGFRGQWQGFRRFFGLVVWELRRFVSEV